MTKTDVYFEGELVVLTHLLEYSGGTFTTDDGKEVTYKNCAFTVGGREVKVNSTVDLTRFVDKDVVVTLQMRPRNRVMRFEVVNAREA